jgi:hypothetical protein
MTDAIRPWCAVAAYPGLAEFTLGTITMPADARHDQIEAALADHAASFLPPGFTIIKPVCGALFFQGEK